MSTTSASARPGSEAEPTDIPTIPTEDSGIARESSPPTNRGLTEKSLDPTVDTDSEGRTGVHKGRNQEKDSSSSSSSASSSSSSSSEAEDEDDKDDDELPKLEHIREWSSGKPFKNSQGNIECRFLYTDESDTPRFARRYTAFASGEPSDKESSAPPHPASAKVFGSEWWDLVSLSSRTWVHGSQAPGGTVNPGILVPWIPHYNEAQSGVKGSRTWPDGTIFSVDDDRVKSGGEITTLSAASFAPDDGFVHKDEQV